MMIQIIWNHKIYTSISLTIRKYRNVFLLLLVSSSFITSPLLIVNRNAISSLPYDTVLSSRDDVKVSGCK